jgi:hypothetical protein
MLQYRLWLEALGNSWSIDLIKNIIKRGKLGGKISS